jgi:glycerol-3-phosphate acyltransferase PlsX|tara:strand:- start:1040 stop:2035 length:996 start_codon:yes stop_codon:yes gene_type:complete
MGGDLGPRVTVSALLDFLNSHRRVQALVFGDQTQVGEQLSLSPYKDPSILARIEIRHSESQVVDSDKPSAVIRHKRDSSMGLALQALAAGEAQAFISAGNTGAIMALGLYFVKALPGISRPAICTTVPTMSGQSYVLDLGANPLCSAAQLYEFALLGALTARELASIESPTVRLLNVGEESNKGREDIQQAAALLEADPEINYCGYIEGDGIFQGGTDVIVCDGFAGNVALKTSEGLVTMVGERFRQAVGRGWLARLALLLLRGPLLRLKTQLDPALYNGAYFLGLDGVVVKSHGGASQMAFVRALEVATQAAEHNLPEILSPILKQKLNQ